MYNSKVLTKLTEYSVTVSNEAGEQGDCYHQIISRGHIPVLHKWIINTESQ